MYVSEPYVPFVKFFNRIWESWSSHKEIDLFIVKEWLKEAGLTNPDATLKPFVGQIAESVKNPITDVCELAAWGEIKAPQNLFRCDTHGSMFVSAEMPPLTCPSYDAIERSKNVHSNL